LRAARNTLIFFLIFAAILEIALRLAQPTLVESVPAYYFRQYLTALMEKNPTLVWSGRPGASAEIENSEKKKIAYRMNSLGWRGKEFTLLERPVNALVFGDSFSFGTGVEESEVYSGQMEKRLKGMSVWNLGQMGYAPDQFLLLAQRWLSAFPWAFLVMQLSGNDLADVTGHEWVNLNSSTGIPAAIKPPAEHAWFTEVSEGWDALAYWRLLSKESSIPEEKLRKGLARLLFSLETIFSQAKDRNIPVVILHAGDWGEPRYGEKISRDYRDGVRNLAERFGAPLVEIQDAEILPYPDLHWTAASHEKAAEKILAALILLRTMGSPLGVAP